MEKVALSREKGDRKEFWKHFTKTNEKNLIHRLASIEAVLDILGQEASQGKPRPEQLIDKNAMNIAFFLDTLKYSLENVDAIFQKETESEYVARRLQKIILFISSFHSKKFFIFLSSFMKVFKKIIDSPNFRKLLLLNIDLSYLIFEKFSFNPFQPLMFEFIPIYYESIFSKSDDPVHFKKYKEVFAKIFECIHTRGIELTGSRNQNFEELRNIWIFWSRILIKLLSKEEIKDFQSLYNSLCFSDFPFKYSKIFHSRVIYSTFTKFSREIKWRSKNLLRRSHFKSVSLFSKIPCNLSNILFITKNPIKEDLILFYLSDYFAIRRESACI